MKNYKFLLDPMRLPFLILTPACVVLGLATAIWTEGTVNWFHFVLVLIGAVSAHISVNAFNEYFDFKSGLDEKTQRTPFSGGSGRLQQNPELGKPALFMAWIFLVCSCSYWDLFCLEDWRCPDPPGYSGIADHIFLY